MIYCARDGWLSETTGLACHKVSGEGDAGTVAAALTQAGDGFYFAKLPVTAVGTVKNYTSGGLFVVDTGVTLEMAAESTPEPGNADVTVRPATVADHDAAQMVAGSAFTLSRFHLDPLFPLALANRIKREWIRSYCEGRRGDVLFVAFLGEKVVGFLAALKADAGANSAAVIDLVAVDASARGRGVGRALVAAFKNHYSGRVALLRVGTQIANSASLKLYRRCGFGFAEAAYVLHAHRKNGACL